MPAWIRTADQLPEPFIPVWAFDGRPFIAARLIDYWIDINRRRLDSAPTWWMPHEIPAPPSEAA